MPGTVLGAEETVEKTDLSPVLMGLSPRLTDRRLLMTGNCSMTSGGLEEKVQCIPYVPNRTDLHRPNAVAEGFLEAVAFELT